MVAVAFAWTAAVASAQPAEPTEDDIQRARRHFEAGEAYFAELRYDDAAREFTEAWEISRRPEMLFNVAIAYERGLHFDEAVAAIEQYLPLATPEERPAAERRLGRLRELRERHRAQQAGTEPAGPEPEPDDAEPVEIGERPSEAGGGGSGSSVAAWILLGTGAASGVGALITGLIAHATYSDLDQACPDRTRCDPALEDDRDSASTLAVISTVLTGVAIAAGGVGITLLLLGGGGGTESSVAVDAHPVPGGAGARATVRF